MQMHFKKCIKGQGEGKKKSAWCCTPSLMLLCYFKYTTVA